MVNGKAAVVAQTPAPKPTDFPKVVSAQLILNSTQAAYPGNEWIKPCGPANHDDACFDPAPKPVPRVADTAAHCICLTDGHGCGKSYTKKACELGGGTWVVSQTLINLSPYPNLSVGAVAVGAYPAKVTASKDFKESVDVDSQTGRVVKLSDDEYARLQKLRQAVADEEKKIAVAHGVDTEGDLYPCGKPTLTILSNMACVVSPEWKPRYPDKWQFRGQWLLINVPPR